MKREILKFKLKRNINGCCPGHDDWPDETYRGRKSKKARSRSKKREHQYARRILNGQININDEDMDDDS